MTLETPSFSPGLDGVPIAESAVSKVDGEAGRLTYRGYSIEELAEGGSFEEVAALLYDGSFPTPERTAEFRSQLEIDRALTEEDVQRLLIG